MAMKRIKLIFVFTVLIFTSVFGQEKKVVCDCPKTPLKIYRLERISNIKRPFGQQKKIYFTGQKVVRKLVVSRQIRKYTQAEIQTVLKAYEIEKAGLDDNKMIIANRLFIATI